MAGRPWRHVLAVTVAAALGLVWPLPAPAQPAPVHSTTTVPIPRPEAGTAGATASVVIGVRTAAPASEDRERTALWGWPLAGEPGIVHGFDPPRQRWGAGHRGIDLAGVAGESVLAVDDGVVTFSGVVAGVGVVSVTHPSGLRSTYQPVADRVGRGARVARGDRVGHLDEGGHCVIRACLHLGAVRNRDDYVDPTPLLLGVELTLLPVDR
ncbi:M23 family metallopeptidase [Serinicoccus sp. CNJ-927]|uniref:M23 family metallopeptidase n=1 Tax=Serinicoccus sp. CNJ-927 TaxID=1904970 RepID=UPI0009FA352D|nr:peptidoglycan DD-metalloendopeptidase family protein [Serinicoccus sp. CNJ-927]